EKEEVTDYIDEPVRISFDDLHIMSVLPLHFLFKGFSKALYRGKGGTQLVGDTRHQIPFDLFDLFHAGNVVKDEDHFIFGLNVSSAAQKRPSLDLHLFERADPPASCLLHKLYELGLSEGLPIELPLEGGASPQNGLQTFIAV